MLTKLLEILTVAYITVKVFIYNQLLGLTMLRGFCLMELINCYMCVAGVWSLSCCRSQSQQQISNKTSEKENYQGAAVVQLKSRPEPD